MQATTSHVTPARVSPTLRSESPPLQALSGEIILTALKQHAHAARRDHILVRRRRRNKRHNAR